MLKRIAWLVLAATVALAAILAVVIVPQANRVVDGKAVEPIGLPGLTILDVRATSATVAPAGKPEDAPAIQDLADRSLLHLGQAGSTLVLFDHRTDEAVHVPAADVVLRVAAPKR